MIVLLSPVIATAYWSRARRSCVSSRRRSCVSSRRRSCAPAHAGRASRLPVRQDVCVGESPETVSVAPEAPVAAYDLRRFFVVPHTHWDREWYQPLEYFRLAL